MAIFDRFDIRVIAVGGLCGLAIALSPGVASAGGGYECVQQSAGEAAPAPGAAVCAPVNEMAGVPMALPGPVVPPLVPPIIPPPLVPPVPPLVPPVPPIVPPVPPLVPPVPIVPIGAPIAAGAPVGGLPLTTMGGAAGGKGDPTGPAPAGAPVPGQPIMPGPNAGTH
jgi:hypothetical protein